MTVLALLEDRSYKTFKARLKAAERLKLLDALWNTALIATSATGAVAAIGSVVDSRMYGVAGPALLAVATVLALVVSLVVAGQGYGARSRNMFVSYRRAQRISVAAEAMKLAPRRPNEQAVARLVKAYNDLLDESENHSEADFQRAMSPGKLTWSKMKSSVLTWLPVIFLVLPFATVAPFISWALQRVFS